MASIFEKYKKFFPFLDDVECLSLGEGNTPLVQSTSLVAGGELFLKMEHLNPTGSFKDRFAAVETELMKQAGIKSFLATSSGNTGSALAAYSAKHGLKCFLFVNEITPESKLKQMMIYGAEVIRVKDFGISRDLSEPIFQRLQDLAVESGTRLVISAYKYSPKGMEGVKTIAYEIVEDLGAAPDQIFVPVGGGGLLSGIFRGFRDLKEQKMIERMPKINAVQPELNDTMVSALGDDLERANEVATTTSISGLAVQVDIDATLAISAVRASKGRGFLVTDADIRQTQIQLAAQEGIYVEPAGSASVAGYLKAVSTGAVGSGDRTVCILTGHGLKDTSEIGSGADTQVKNVGIADITQQLLHY